jgi:hypothetical protein
MSWAHELGSSLTLLALSIVGASYRWVAGVELGGLRDEDLSGLTGELSLRLGRF